MDQENGFYVTTQRADIIPSGPDLMPCVPPHHLAKHPPHFLQGCRAALHLSASLLRLAQLWERVLNERHLPGGCGAFHIAGVVWRGWQQMGSSKAVVLWNPRGGAARAPEFAWQTVHEVQCAMDFYSSANGNF